MSGSPNPGPLLVDAGPQAAAAVGHLHGERTGLSMADLDLERSGLPVVGVADHVRARLGDGQPDVVDQVRRQFQRLGEPGHHVPHEHDVLRIGGQGQPNVVLALLAR